MTCEIVNLNIARKAKARIDSERLAEGNRAKFGISKPARVKELHEKDQRDRLLDGARRDSPANEAGVDGEPGGGADSQVPEPPR